MAFGFGAQQTPQTPFQLQQPQAQQSFQFQQQQQQQTQLFPQQQQQLQFQQQQQQQQFLLYTKERAPAAYGTKWDDLHPDSQKLLLQIEERIRDYRDESERLEQCTRLYDSSVSNDSFELDASRILQELQGTATAIEREKASVQELMNVVNQMMWNTEFTIRSYMMLRPRFIHSTVGASQASASANPSGTALTAGQSNQMAAAPVYEFYSGLPRRPSVFMQHTVARFEKYLEECCKWIQELEQLLQMDSDRKASDSLSALPKVMSNVHDYFVHVASKLENLHQLVESMKRTYLTDLCRLGDSDDPFLEANRREEAKQEAAARRVHPTLHLPISAQPTTQNAGLLTNTATPAQSTPQLLMTSAAATSSSPLFATPSSSQPTFSNLFSTPTAAAPSSNMFGSTGSAPQSNPFGAASSPLFQTPQSSPFGTSTPSFSSTPGLGSTLFATSSLGAGGATAASFGAGSKSRTKNRTTTRR